MQGMQMPYQQQMWPGQPMPGQYPGMPMYAMPKPPSPFSDPKTLVDKLPMFAMIALIGFSLYGLLNAISTFIFGAGISKLFGALSDLSSMTGGGSTPGAGGITAPVVLMGIGQLCYGVAIGVVVFAALMSLKHFLDLKQAKLDALTNA